MATNIEIQKGFDFLDAIPRYRRVTANALLMSDALHAENGRRITPEVLQQIFRRIKPQLAVNDEYAEAYQTFFERHPEYGLEANMAILDGVLTKHGEAVTAENLEELLMPGNPHCVLHQLAMTAEAAKAQADEQERQAIISDLVGGLKPVIDERGRKVLTNRSGFRVLYAAEVERINALPLEGLRQLRDEKAEKKRLQQMSSEEVRQTLRQTATPFSRYEKLPDQYFPPGKEVGLPWSANLFRRLPSQEQRRLLAHYGDEQLTAAINAAGRN